MKLDLFPIWVCSKRDLSLVGISLGSFIFFYARKERILFVVSEYDQQMLFPLLVCAYVFKSKCYKWNSSYMYIAKYWEYITRWKHG